MDDREIKETLSRHRAKPPVMYEGKRTQNCLLDDEPWPCQTTRWGTILLAVLELPPRWEHEGVGDAAGDFESAGVALDHCADELRAALDG